MKDAELLKLLKKAEDVFEVKSRHTLEYVQEAIAALEANPPLAEVEGYINKYDEGMPFELEGATGAFVLTEVWESNEGWEAGATAVTVTIRKRLAE